MPKVCARAGVIVFFQLSGYNKIRGGYGEREIICVTTSLNDLATLLGHVAPAGHAKQVPFVRDVLTVSKKLPQAGLHTHEVIEFGPILF